MTTELKHSYHLATLAVIMLSSTHYSRPVMMLVETYYVGSNMEEQLGQLWTVYTT